MFEYIPRFKFIKESLSWLHTEIGKLYSMKYTILMDVSTEFGFILFDLYFKFSHINLMNFGIIITISQI